MYREMNMEVSMPTGSLCAERNVIGTALASIPGLLREHLKMVAVLAVSIQSDEAASSPVLSSSLAPGIDPNLCQPIDAEGVPTNESIDLTMDLQPSDEKKLSKVIRSVSSPDLSTIPHVRKIRLHNYCTTDNIKANKFQRKKKRTVLVQEKDRNPLEPCGACNEWLKKIAESNPDFKVITFTDTNCNGVYVMPCN